MPKESQTPVRRSKRFQPFITPPRKNNAEASSTWSGEWWSKRPTKVDDLSEAQREEWDEDAAMQTAFYNAFDRRDTKKGGAKNQTETYQIGDTVLVKPETVASGRNTRKGQLPSVAVIVAMWDIANLDESEDDNSGEEMMRVKVHWFVRPNELASFRAKREAVENEIYYSLQSTSTLIPDRIICPCTVSSLASNGANKSTQRDTSRIKKSRTLPSPDEGSDDTSLENFYCGFAVDSQRGLFSALDWDAHRSQCTSDNDDHRLETGDEWNIVMDYGHDRDYEEDSNKDDEDEDEDDCDDGDGDETDSTAPRTSREKLASATTPRRRKRTRVLPTPHSKRALRARAKKKSPSKMKSLAVRPPQELYRLQLDHLNLSKDPWLRAMHVLHVAARPEALPCREEEYGRVLREVDNLLEEGSGGCIYISGVPGTGKTATVHAVVRELKRMAENSEINPFTFVEINGLRIPEPSAAYSLLWESVSGHDVAAEGHLKISSKEALNRLTRHFSAGGRAGPRGHACVVLMDELDQLVTVKQEVVYNFFNWPTLTGSKLVVLAVANTMDLPERAMTGRVRSRLGLTRINFQPYTTVQLDKIVKARLESAKEGLEGNVPDVIAPDGIRFAAMKVASISGDARRVLEICRRAVELVQPDRRAARADDIKSVIKVMQNSPTAAYLRDCSLHERILLASLLKCMKRDGIEEVKWGDIKYQHLIYMNILPGQDDSSRKPTPNELSLVLDSLLASRAILMEDGGAASRKPDDEKKVVLNLEQIEVERVLGEEGGQRWKNVLST